ncbi:Excinuclease ABC subunit A [hydrothermal vent metagenome]|uniref:Excinuclease ABC subunit A n=1 Tax=hydrothermal vent metagenome TaxID=652676 RepID=A0A1W1CTH4_9ZZZZ
MENISIRGARVHNLKNIDVDIPRNKLVVITGLSGSGKSSLAFDTIYAEGQRRYVESLSAYARQFLSLMEKPDVDLIEGLSPAISIEQKATSHNPRSTVGTITEIYDYLRLLFARVGNPICPTHKIPLQAQTISEMVDATLKLPEGEKIMILAPIIRNRKGEHKKLLYELSAQGFLRVRVDGIVEYIDSLEEIDAKTNHNIEVVVDRLKIREDIKIRLAESLETALNLTNGLAILAPMAEDSFEEITFSSKFSCTKCDYSLQELEPRLFSFNNIIGACSSCDGLGKKEVFNPKKVVANPELSLADGAIPNWGTTHAYFYQILFLVANHYDFDIDTPFEELDKKFQDIVLFGSGKEVIDFSKLKNRFARKKKKRPFEGVIKYMQRRYEESEINSVREELKRYIEQQQCPSCNGQRLNPQALNVLIDGRSISDITELSIAECFSFWKNLKFEGKKQQIADKILKEIIQRLQFLLNVGLEYLSLNRCASTLSGGEAQRIRLASQIGAGLMGVLYVLDEPSIGLHQRDNQKLLDTLTYLRDLGNTVIVVEHDEDAILQADFVVDIGAGAGIHGGEVIAIGTPEEIKNNKNSITGDYLSGRKKIAVPETRLKAKDWFRLIGATGNNLKNITLELPIGCLTCITGVSGSGKSTLINRTLYPITANELNRAQQAHSPYEKVEGMNFLDKVININQSPIGRTPRSNPATYTGIFTLIRELFAQSIEARTRGYKAGRFSFNVKGGRCEACKGDGLIKVEMHFLADMFVPCDVCHGDRYNRESLEITYKNKNIAQVLDMTIAEANDFFEAIPSIHKKLQTLMQVGLSYISLGQNAVTLSGGEAQRIKLAKELSKSDTGHTLYILDEPTTGLHFHDIAKLLEVIQQLRDRGNTVVVIEHNLDVIKTADWVVDLGPNGGDGGGEIVACGTPEDICLAPNSVTGKFLSETITIPK